MFSTSAMQWQSCRSSPRLVLGLLALSLALGAPASASPFTILSKALSAFSQPATDNRMAIAIYAPSSYARQLKCEALVESIRSQGQWGGRLYLITEQLKCYQHERWMQCGLDADIIALDDKRAAEQVAQQEENTSLKWWLKFGPTWEAYKSRLMWTRLWDILQPPETVESIMYIHGCEVLVGAPLEPFMRGALERMTAPDGPMVVVAPPAVTAPLPASQTQEAAASQGQQLGRKLAGSSNSRPHTGNGDVWMLHKKASAKLLEAWHDEVLQSPAPRMDEDSLLLASVQQAGGMKCWGAHALECMAKYVGRMDGFAQRLQCDKLEGCNEIPTVFNYIPDSVCASVDHEMVSDWVNTLDLCVYQDLGYCVPRMMKVFQHSWLPYPKCGKLELGLSRLACQWTCTEPSVMRSPHYRTSVTQRPLTIR